MTRVKSHSSRFTKNHPLSSGAFISNTQAKQLRINQQSQQDIQSVPENRAITLSPSTSFAYTTVVLNILFYGISKSNLPLIYIACCMATALLGPLALKMLLPLIREIFLPKGSEK
jgi:FtsH-binding integral membrane protein